ncbi:MAG: mechanosensitive ion channel family protein, partial [Variovorax sp.]
MLLAHPWFGPGLAAVIAVPLALLAHRLGGLVLRRVTRSMPVLHAMLIAIQAPARAVLPLVALQMVWQAAPDDVRFIDSVRH